MTQITKEAIEAASAAYTGTSWQFLSDHTKTHVRICMKLAIEAALPFLPIAVEGKVAAPINWEDANDPAVKLFVGYDVEGYVEEYELCGDDGDYTPNESEKTLIADAIHGVIFDIHEKLRAIIPSSPGKDGGQGVEAVGYRWKLNKESPWGYGSYARTDAYVCEPVYTRPQAASTALAEALASCEDYFENRADAEYFTDSATPVPNAEMRLLQVVRDALKKAGA